jgi:D-alanyl-D-alanine carboxypeptidase
MNAVTEVQARIEAIRNQVEDPPVPGGFHRVLQTHLATAAPEAIETEPTDRAAEFTVTPQQTTGSASWARATASVTLGAMLGITSGPGAGSAPATVASKDALAAYLERNDIRARNGRLEPADLSDVSGAWTGTGRLLPPAAAAWEEMRAAAAGDGIDLRAIDLYRSYESQSRAYEAHLHGEKTANVLPPGTSEHGAGLAVDVTNGQLIGTGDPEYAWLHTHGWEYGWYPISNESWHWEFRGISS